MERAGASVRFSARSRRDSGVARARQPRAQSRRLFSDEPMNATAAKPETAQRLSRAELRRRWRQLADDPVVAAIPCKVELNEKGAIEVSPPTTRHAFIQGFVMRELARQRPRARHFTECPVETDIGMRVPDVVWASPEFMERHRDEKEFRVAPDLCVEVLSPTNTRIEMAEKDGGLSRRRRAKKSGSSTRTAFRKSTRAPAECRRARSGSSCRARQRRLAREASRVSRLAAAARSSRPRCRPATSRAAACRRARRSSAARRRL